MAQNVYERMLEAVQDKPESVRQRTEQLIRNVEAKKASRQALAQFMELVGYDPTRLKDIKLEKVEVNPEKGRERKVQDKSALGRDLVSMSVYFSYGNKTMKPLGWQATRKQIEAGTLSHLEGTLALEDLKTEQDVRDYQEKQRRKALKDYVKTLTEARESPEKVQKRTERRQVESLLGLEERLDEFTEGSQEAIKELLKDPTHYKERADEMYHILWEQGGVISQLQKRKDSLDDETRTALEALTDRKSLIPTPEYAKHTNTLLEYSQGLPVKKDVILGDLQEDLQEIAGKPEAKLFKTQNKQDLHKLLDMLHETSGLSSLAGRRLYKGMFRIYEHRRQQKEELMEQAEYKEDFDEGVDTGRQMFRDGDKWLAENPHSLPTGTVLKDLVLLGAYKHNSKQLRDHVMRIQQNLYATRDELDDVVESQAMRETRDRFDATTVLGRKTGLLKKHGYEPLKKDKEEADKAKDDFDRLRRDDERPNEAFEREHGITLEELANRIETTHEENPKQGAAQALFPDRQGNTTIPYARRELQQALDDKLYHQGTTDELDSHTHPGRYGEKTVLRHLLDLKRWSAQDEEHQEALERLRSNPGLIDKSGLPSFLYEQKQTYIPREESEELAEAEKLEQQAPGPEAWEGYEDTIRKYNSFFDTNRSGNRKHRIIKPQEEGLVARLEDYQPGDEYEVVLKKGGDHDQVIALDPKKKDALEEEMENYIPLDKETVEKAMYFLDFEEEGSAYLKNQGIKQDGKTWGMFKWMKENPRIREDTYIEKRLKRRIDDLYDEAHGTTP